MKNMKGGPGLVVILSDGIRGHLFQSRGIAGWLAQETGTIVEELEVPKVSGFRKLCLLKLKGRHLPSMDKKSLEDWLAKTGATQLMEQCQTLLTRHRAEPHEVLFISAGSGTAAFNLALSSYLAAKSCALMTPSFIGSNPFDFAIVPLHDRPKDIQNVLPTLGAPNSIFPEKLKQAAEELATLYPQESQDRWALLIGGDDGNYRISGRWVEENVKPIVSASAAKGADLYITTSRRTAQDAEDALVHMAANQPHVKMLLLASQNPLNPVPGMMGLCNRVFCTEDSVSMVSEAITAGHRVILMGVEHRKGIKGILQQVASPLYLWGIPRFNTLFDAFKKKGCLVEYSPQFLESGEGLKGIKDFNEARRAALWIIERWKE
jgi:mitochondrial fission protein ELM1